MTNAYLDLIKTRKTDNVKIILSPKRQIVLNQNNKCFLCGSSLSNVICHFTEITAPDKKAGLPSTEARALCPSCFFGKRKNKTDERKIIQK